jgi:insertion element IS1 protein InsB
VDRNRNKICDFEIGDRSFATYYKLAERLEKAYNIKHLCTDNYEAYRKYRISEFHHTTKAETSLVEAKNSSLRDNLARLNRRTKRISKSIEMLKNTILLFINKQILCIN